MLDSAAAAALRAQVGQMSDTLWRDLLRGCGVPLAPLLEGVRQETFENLERTLLLLWQEYAGAGSEVRKQCRTLVIEAKDRARLAARNPKVSEDKRQQKQEMVLWMLTWLENPDAFELWVGLRKLRLSATAVQSTPPE